MTQTETDVILSEEVSEGVYQITINRPSRRNALNLEIKNKLADTLVALEHDPAVRVVVLTGTAGFFVAGTDLDEQTTMTPTFHTLLETDRIFSVLHHYSKPAIAAVEGFALGGGCELALACDMIVAGEGAKFGQPEIRVGVMPGAGGTQRLMRTIGKYQTMKIVMTGEFVDARDALTMGFVTEVTPKGEALARALDLARTVASMPPLGIRGIKEVARAGADMSLDAALLLERKAFQILFDSKDQEEGMRAFLEKRKPGFEGK